MRINRFIGALVAGLVLSASLFANGSKESATKESAPKEINISFVQSPFNIQVMVMKERALLEKAFAEKGVEVKWYNIDSGAHQTEAMAAGSLDIGSVVNTTSIILANAAGNRVEIAGIVSRPKRTFALMVGPEGPTGVADLKGKTIAGPKGTVLHQMLAAALVSEGLSMKDVDFVSMGLPEARTALLAGKVDGALQAASLIIRDQEAGMRILFTADGYLSPTLVTAVRPDFAKRYPALLDLYLKVQRETAEWIEEHRTEAVAIGSKVQGISEGDGAKLYDWNGMAAVMTRDDVAAMKNDVAFLEEQGMIRGRVDPSDFVLDAAFIER